MEKHVLGLDFGTLSVRAVLVNVQTGEEQARADYTYPHGVMTSILPDGSLLPPHFALAHPEDYRLGLVEIIRRIVAESGLPPACIVAIGMDATASSLIPVDENNIPVCLLPGFKNRPHSYIKLWKHHGITALRLSARIQSVAQERREPWCLRYGGRFNGEALMPKILETLSEDPEVYEKTHSFLEVGDWLIRLLTGSPVRSRSMAACNCLYDQDTGFPSGEFFAQVLPGTERLAEKLGGRMIPLGRSAGTLSGEMAFQLGLSPDTVVSSSLIDCHAAVPGCGMGLDGDLTMALGTSSCFLLNSAREISIPGIYSVAYEAHIPGLYGYEGGQSCVGDAFQWFVDNCVPGSMETEARNNGQSVFALLEKKAAELLPGESGLLALDWWNGVRTPLLDYDLSGAIFGLELSTPPEALYRAMLESACFGARQIIDLYENAGCPVKRITACGGLAQKNTLLMQILADVCGREIAVSSSTQPCALGSAVLAACAAGCGEFSQLLAQMCRPPQRIYQPHVETREVYRQLYEEYCRMFEHLSGEDRITNRLRDLKIRQQNRRLKGEVKG